MIKSERLKISRNANAKHYLFPYKSTWNSVKKMAREKNIPCSLTYGEFLTFTKIKSCFYCEKEIEWHKHGPKAASRYNLDRKDNSLGYHITNLVVCCWNCNNLKGNKINFDDFCFLSDFLLKDKNKPHWSNNYSINNFMNLNKLGFE